MHHFGTIHFQNTFIERKQSLTVWILDIHFVFLLTLFVAALESNVTKDAANLDKDLSQMLGKQFNISSVNRTIAVNLLKRIYTNTTFEENIGAFIRVRLPISSIAYHLCSQGGSR